MKIDYSRRTFLQATLAAGVGTLALPASAASSTTSRKKGCCFTAGKESPWLANLQALQGRWLYTWGAKKPADLPADVEFCPMIWGNVYPVPRAKLLDRLREQVRAGEIKCVMGFNEPDQPKQSNMTVERVVQLWPELMDLEVPLVSPGCVHPDREWMRDFMEQVEQKNLRVDYVSVHSYAGPDADGLVKRLEKIHREFGKPLWITEFAVGDWEAKSAEQNRHSAAKIAQFMKRLLPMLDELPFVDRYSWFSAGTGNAALGTSALIDKQGKLTELGRVYADHGKAS